MKAGVITLVLLILKLTTSAQETDSLIDTRDGQIYKTVKIGSQIWMAENLNYVPDSGSICYDNLSSNCKLYGRLYVWDVAKSVCPDGWHLSSEEDWQTLERFLGMTDDEVYKRGFRGGNVNIGGKLKSKTGWPAYDKITYEDIGFNALPSGNYGFHENVFGLLFSNALFWTSTPFSDEFAYFRDLYAYDNMIFRGHKFKRIGFSVRCVKN